MGGRYFAGEGVVREKEKIHVIHDLTFEGPIRGAGESPTV